MKHLKKFNEEKISTSFNEIYSKEIKSRDITIEVTDYYLKIKNKDEKNIPELDDLGFEKETDGFYWVPIPRKLTFGDVIVFNSEVLEKLLSKTPEDIKNELQKMYNDKYKNESYVRDMKIRQLFSEYLK